MITNHNRSEALHAWSVIDTVVAIILLAVGIGFAIFEENFSVMGVGICLLMLVPILRGLSVLVENAEDQIMERQKASRPTE